MKVQKSYCCTNLIIELALVTAHGVHIKRIRYTVDFWPLLTAHGVHIKRIRYTVDFCPFFKGKNGQKSTVYLILLMWTPSVFDSQFVFLFNQAPLERFPSSQTIFFLELSPYVQERQKYFLNGYLPLTTVSISHMPLFGITIHEYDVGLL